MESEGSFHDSQESGGTDGLLGDSLGASSVNQDNVRESQASQLTQGQSFGAEDRFAIDDAIFMARTAELSTNFEDMTGFIKGIIQTKQIQKQKLPGGTAENFKTEPCDWTKKERDTITVALKHGVSKQRVAIRIIKALLENQKYAKFEPSLRTYRNQLELEVFEFSESVVGLIRQNCIQRKQNANSADSEAYFLKLLGDHYRYMAEVAVPKQMALAQDSATGFYDKAWKHIEANELHPLNETRLGTAMNYTVFLTDILGNTDKAIKISQQTIADGEAQLQNNEGSVQYDEARNLIEMLKENIEAWTGNPYDKPSNIQAREFDV